jgi:hypothetical protein
MGALDNNLIPAIVTEKYLELGARSSRGGGTTRCAESEDREKIAGSKKRVREYDARFDEVNNPL